MTNGTTELFCKEKSLYIVTINAVSILLWSLSSHIVALLNSQTLQIVPNIWNNVNV